MDYFLCLYDFTKKNDNTSLIMLLIRKESMSDFNEVQLSDREVQIVIEMARGYSMKEVGEKLFISKYTVLSHKKNIYKKLGISKLIQIGVYAERQGYLKDKGLML